MGLKVRSGDQVKVIAGKDKRIALRAIRYEEGDR
jgi:hypothetical protein